LFRDEGPLLHLEVGSGLENLCVEQLPAVEGVILSHDHYDHLDVPTIEYLARRVQRYFVPLGVKARLVEMGVDGIMTDYPDRLLELVGRRQAR